MRSLIYISLTAVAVTLAGFAAVPDLFPVLKSAVHIGKQPAGFFVLPTNQLLQPWGEQAMLKGRPVDATLDSSKRFLAVLNSRGIDIFDAHASTPLGSVRTKTTSYTGIAFRPGKDEIWTGETSRNGPDFVLVTPVSKLGVPGPGYEIALGTHAVPSGVAFSADGKFAYVAMNRSNTLAVYDAETRKLLKEVPTGIAPFAVVYSKQHRAIFVSNRAGRVPRASETTAPSSGANALTDPVTGTTVSGTVSVIDEETLTAKKEVEVGRAPSGMALSPDESLLAIANGHSDSISILNTATLAHSEVKIPAYPQGVTGSQPIAVAFAGNGKTLYVACAGTNAIANLVQSGSKWTVAGSVPTGWFPSAINVMEDGSLRVVNIKGTGNTANDKGSFSSLAYEGALERIPALSAGQLTSATHAVIAANSPKLEPAGGVSNLVSLGIQHVLLIIKENRTYDQVLGDLSQANGDASLTMFGRKVTPNHHALAEQFIILDNFHTGGAISFDGHQWLMQSFVSDYTERAFVAPRGYAWNMADALTVAPTGFFWQGAPKTPSVRIWGEFCLPAKWDASKNTVVDINESQMMNWSAYWKLYKEGKLKDLVASRSGVPALQKLIDPRYPNNDTNITDQVRADEFLRELGEFEKSGNMPQLNVLTMTSNHTNGTRPDSPTPRAMVADNDLALGRIVEGVTKSRFWPSTLIFVVEDDAQNGLDHVDGHRTVALAIGAHIRRGVVDSNFYDHSSMIRTIQDLFRIPPQTRFVAAARTMTSVFTPAANAGTYKALPAEIALDEMNPPLKALNGRQLWAAKQSLAMNWHDPDDIPSDTLNHILWWDSKGYDKEYPKVGQRVGN